MVLVVQASDGLLVEEGFQFAGWVPTGEAAVLLQEFLDELSDPAQLVVVAGVGDDEVLFA